MTTEKRGVLLPVEIPEDFERAALALLFTKAPELKDAAEEMIAMLVKFNVFGARPAVHGLILKTISLTANVMEGDGTEPPPEPDPDPFAPVEQAVAIANGTASPQDKAQALRRLLRVLSVDAHELALIRARVGDRGTTDCSTPLPIQIENLIEENRRLHESLEMAVRKRGEN